MHRIQQGSITDARAARWQCRLCTAAVGVARGARDMVSHSVHAALSTSSQKAPASPAAASRSMHQRRSSCGCFLQHERSASGRCNFIHRVAHTSGVRTVWLPKRCVTRRPSALLRHGHAARCQRGLLLQLPLHAAAAAAGESSGCGATWRTGCATRQPEFVTSGHVVATWPQSGNATDF